MPQFESITLALPAHWLTPVLYGDTDHLEPEEQTAFNRWLNDTIREVGHGKMPVVGTIHDKSFFARYHDAAEYGVLACDCYDVELLVEVVSQEPNKLEN